MLLVEKTMGWEWQMVLQEHNKVCASGLRKRISSLGDMWQGLGTSQTEMISIILICLSLYRADAGIILMVFY